MPETLTKEQRMDKLLEYFLEKENLPLLIENCAIHPYSKSRVEEVEEHIENLYSFTPTEEELNKAFEIAVSRKHSGYETPLQSSPYPA